MRLPARSGSHVDDLQIGEHALAPGKRVAGTHSTLAKTLRHSARSGSHLDDLQVRAHALLPAERIAGAHVEDGRRADDLNERMKPLIYPKLQMHE